MSSWNIRESTILECSRYPLTNNVNVYLFNSVFNNIFSRGFSLRLICCLRNWIFQHISWRHWFAMKFVTTVHFGISKKRGLRPVIFGGTRDPRSETDLIGSTRDPRLRTLKVGLVDLRLRTLKVDFQKIFLTFSEACRLWMSRLA